MKALFVHQNFPGQFLHLAPALAERGAEVFALTEQSNRARAARLATNVKVFGYASPRAAAATTHPYLQSAEAHVRRGQAVARAALKLRDGRYSPDIIVGHPAWGECLFLKDVFPKAKLLLYAEFFYRGSGSDFNFDPEYPSGFDPLCKLRLRNTTQWASFDAADAAISPTHWQRTQYPAAIRDKITVAHDGIDTCRVHRRADAALTLPGGRTLTAADEVVSYVARNLEPYRGFHQFMRALPRILQARPQATVVVVGGDDVSYGHKPPAGTTYRDKMLQELGAAIDPERVHFLGRIPYDRYLALLSLSSVHIYLTYPFVLSWSLLEAMACEWAIVASRTPPVEEAIKDGKEGFLVDFFSPGALADKVIEVLRSPQEAATIRLAARQKIERRYALERCLAVQMQLIEELVGKTARGDIRSAA